MRLSSHIYLLYTITLMLTSLTLTPSTSTRQYCPTKQKKTPYDPDKSVGQIHYRYSPSAHNHQYIQHNLSRGGRNPRPLWVMDYHHLRQQSLTMGESKGGGGYNKTSDVGSPLTRYTGHPLESQKDTDGGRDVNNNRMTPYRHHITYGSSDLSGSMLVSSEAVSPSPSDMALQDQYTIKEPISDMYESSDNDKNTRKVSLSPDIQYWFDQKKKMDQLLLPLPEKGTSTANVPANNNAKPKNGPKPIQGRTNNNVLRLPTRTTAIPPQHLQQQFTHISGERDISERHFAKKIFDDGGKISAKDLKDAFATFQNKHFSDGVCKFVVRLFDLDRNGGLDIKEFEQLYSYIKLWVSAYHIYDRHHLGYLTEKDFHNALKHMDIHFSPEFISFLVTRCDPINRRVSLSQFIVTCVQIQKYTDEFKNRDDNYSGTINLRYEDFLEMVLRCL